MHLFLSTPTASPFRRTHTAVAFAIALFALNAQAHAQGPRVEESEISPASRIAIEGGVGAAVGAALWIPGMVLGVNAHDKCVSDVNRKAASADGIGGAVENAIGTLECEDEGTEFVGAAYALTIVAVPTSVYLAGELAGGNGNYWYTLLGSGLGTATGLLAAVAVVAAGDDGDGTSTSFGVLALTALTLPTIVGSVLGYELSQEGPSSDAPKRAKGTTVVPSVGSTADGQGGMLSLSGTF